MAELKSQGNIVPTTKLGPVGARIPRVLSPTINPLAGAAKVAEESLFEKRQLEGAEAAYNTELSINPQTGLPELPPEKDAGINIFQQSFNKTLRKNYLSSIEGATRAGLLGIADQHYLSPKEFSEVGSRYLKTVIDGAEPFAKGHVEDIGGKIFSGLLQSTRNRFARQQIADARRTAQTLSGEAAEALASGQHSVGSEETSKVITQFVDNAIASIEGGGQALRGRRDSIIKETLKVHAQNSYLASLRALPIREANQALINFQMGKPYKNKSGQNIFAPFKGMTQVDRRQILAVLTDSHRARASYHNREKEASAEAAYKVIAGALKTSLGLSKDHPFNAALDQINDQKALISVIGAFKAYHDRNRDEESKVAMARTILPFMESLAEANGVNFQEIKDKFKDKEAAEYLTTLSRIVTVNTQQRNVEEAKARDNGIRELGAAQFNAFKNASGEVGGEHVAKIEEQISLIEKNNNLPAGDKAREILKVVRQGIREGTAAIRQAANTEEDYARGLEYAQALAKLVGLERHIESVTDLAKDAKYDGLSPGQVISLARVHISELAKQEEAANAQQALFQPLFLNQQLYGLGKPIVPIVNNAKNRQAGDLLFETFNPEVARLIQDGKANEVYSNQTGHLKLFVESTGVIPQGAADTIASMAGSADTMATALSAYKMLKNISGGGHLIKSALPDHILKRLDLIDSIGPTPENIQYALIPHVQGEAKDQSALIYAKPDGTPLKPKELKEAYGKDLAKVLTQQSTTTKGIVSTMLDRFAAFILHSGVDGSPRAGGYSALPPELRERVHSQYLQLINDIKINPDTMPDVFKRQVATDFYHNGLKYIRNPGEESERLTALAHSVENVLRKGDWFVGKYDADRPRNSGAGLSISYQPIEMYITTPASKYDESGREYFDKEIVEIVNRNMARFGVHGTLASSRAAVGGVDQDTASTLQKPPGQKQEWYTADDIRLLPIAGKLNSRGQPMYQVFLSSESKGLLMAIEPQATVEDSGELIGEIEHGPMYIDPAPIRDIQMDRIQKKIKVDKLLRVSSFKDHWNRIYGEHVYIHEILPKELPHWVERAATFNSDSLKGLAGVGVDSTVLSTSFYDKKLGGELLVPTIRADKDGKLYKVKDPVKVAKDKGDYILISGPDGAATRKKATRASIAISTIIDALRSGKEASLNEAAFRRAEERGLVTPDKRSKTDGTVDLLDEVGGAVGGAARSVYNTLGNVLNELFPEGQARVEAYKKKRGK